MLLDCEILISFVALHLGYRGLRCSINLWGLKGATSLGDFFYEMNDEFTLIIYLALLYFKIYFFDIGLQLGDVFKSFTIITLLITFN